MLNINPLPATPDILNVARRVVWFKAPEEELADPVHFLAHVMTFGTPEDLKALQGIVSIDDFREVLEQAPPGVFDARSWAYWNLRCGRQPAPPLPTRTQLLSTRPTP
jgi:hypothetical protein